MAPFTSTATGTSLLRCAMECYHSSACASYNYHGQQKECQLLASVNYLDNDNLVEDQGWSYYQPDDTPPCPGGKYLIPYEIQNEANHDPNNTANTCSGHPWITQQHAEGKTNCRMVLRYNTEFKNHNMSGFANAVMPYREAFAQCRDFDCLGMVCSTFLIGYPCWMKDNTHLSLDQAPYDDIFLDYWYTECTAP